MLRLYSAGAGTAKGKSDGTAFPAPIVPIAVPMGPGDQGTLAAGKSERCPLSFM